MTNYLEKINKIGISTATIQVMRKIGYCKAADIMNSLINNGMVEKERNEYKKHTIISKADEIVDFVMTLVLF